MKVLVLSENLPTPRHTKIGAVDIVLNALITELSRHDIQVALQAILPEHRRPLTAEERQLIRGESNPQVKIFEPLFRSDYALAERGLLRYARHGYASLFRQMAYYYPAIKLRPVIEKRIAEFGADAILIFWDPAGLAASYQVGVPKLAYYGMPDYAAVKARLEDGDLFGVKLSPLRRALVMAGIQAREKHQLTLMMDCQTAANICAEHADFYRECGHPHSIYVPNMYPAIHRDSTGVCPSSRMNGKAKIFGSMGYMGATGNTYGFKCIGEEIVPRLDALLGREAYEIHVFGSGEPVPAVRAALNVPNIKMRGWVEDIDSEIQSADVFLVANNTGRYKGSHTRFLHAWSLGACCVSHTYNQRANPEMIHGENVLMGETADGIVHCVVEAIKNPELRAKIGADGRRAYETHFTPTVVVERLVKELRLLAG